MTTPIRVSLWLLVFLLAFPSAFFSQRFDTLPRFITWGPAVQISTTDGSAFVPKIAVVGDTVHVVYYAGAMYYRRSIDGGKNWGPQLEIVSVDSMPGQIWNRPFVASGRNLGFIWANRASPSGDARGVKIRRSTDAGTTWLDPEYVLYNQPPLITWQMQMIAAKGQNMWLAANRYVSGYMHTFLRRSHDGGATWDSVRQITFGTYGFGSWDIAASSQGIHIVYETDVPPSRDEVGQITSKDGGDTWSAGEILSTVDAYRGWEPQVSADDSGNVYCCWQDAKYGSTGYGGTLLIRRSSDNGLTWGQEILINSIPSAIRSSLATSGTHVDVLWDDERYGTFNSRSFYSTSEDWGVTWSQEFQVTDSSRAAVDPSLAANARLVFAGWSSNISPPNAIFLRRGERSTTSVELSEIKPSSEIILLQNYPNPFNSRTWITYKLNEGVRLRLSVFDMIGRELTVITDGSERAGVHTISFDADRYASGVYFVVLQADNQKEVKPILLLK